MKNYRPFFFLISLFCVFSSILFARPAREEGIEPLAIYGLKGPSGVGMIRMFESPPEINGFDIKMESLPSADLMAARLISGEAKMGILPANTAAKIFSSGGNIKLAAVTGAGMLRLLTSDPEIKRIEDLRGKTVAVAGHGAIPDYVFRRLLLVRGINPETDVHLNYSLAYPEIAQSLISGRISIALLPEPFATMARAGRADLREAVDIQEEWISSGGEGNYRSEERR
ncbi:MAG: ABC transporter substrate-binding protein, partial [Treponema sp.]|nr:ABC transporter substrate-binding protein [Treponema sp.]